MQAAAQPRRPIYRRDFVPACVLDEQHVGFYVADDVTLVALKVAGKADLSA